MVAVRWAAQWQHGGGEVGSMVAVRRAVWWWQGRQHGGGEVGSVVAVWRAVWWAAQQAAWWWQGVSLAPGNGLGCPHWTGVSSGNRPTVSVCF